MPPRALYAYVPVCLCVCVCVAVPVPRMHELSATILSVMVTLLDGQSILCIGK